MASLKDLTNSVNSFISNQLGLGSNLKSASGSSAEPWGSDPGTDIFFPTPQIDGTKWNQVYPYRLVVVDVSKSGNPIVGGNGNARVQNNFFQDGTSYTLQQSLSGRSWIYELPITPQQLSITNQYAINTTATARGVVEEHNGIRFKMINMSGTTGVWNKRPSKAAEPNSPTILGTVFGGTLQAAGNALDSVRRIKSAFTGDNPNTPSKAGQPPVMQTGYEQMLLLENFIERYTTEKKKEANRGWRLVLDVPKLNQSYVVTPIALQISQTKDRPHERMFNIQLKAWKRIKISSTSFETGSVKKLDVNFFQRALNTINETRRLLANSIKLLQAVRGDFQKPLEALRQTALAIKDVGGFAFTLTDLPKEIVKDYKSSIQDSINVIKNSFNRGNNPTPIGTPATGTSANAFKFSSQAEKAGFAIDQLIRQSEINEGMNLSLVNEGNLGNEAVYNASLANFNAIFEEPAEYFEFFDTINLDALNLSTQQLEDFQDELSAVSLINIDDLISFRNDIKDLVLDISNNFGTGSDTYSRIYNRPDPKTRSVPLSIEENEIMAALYESIQIFDGLVATSQFDDISKLSPLAFIGGIARDNDIPFDDGATSKFLAPVPAGLGIEEISARYLGDANRWIEIATLNALRSPYIDESGFSYNFLSNGDGRQFTVNDVDRALYPGQKIILQSNNVPAFSRKITSVEKLSDEVFLITVDGLSDLDSLSISQNARMRGYLPGTVNSQDLIYIPSNLPSADDDRVTIPKQYQEDDLTKISKIDWLLDDNGDIVIDSFGEVKLANGLTNLIQALKLKMLTRRGTILAHPEFGLGLKAGISVADIIGGEIIKEMDEMIRQDGRFDGIERMSVNIKNNTVQIDMAVRLRNNTGILPITFDL